jgi:NADH dehydrogenase
MPGDGSNLLQPIWIEDLVTCILLAAADDNKRNRVIPVGGIEYLTYLEILKLVMKQTGIQRKPLGVTPEFLRGLTLWIAQVYPKLPVSIFWLDYLAVDRITSLDSVPREFGLIPARFKNKIDYLNKKI